MLKRRILLPLAVTICLVLFAAGLVQASSPLEAPQFHAFGGDVTINGSPAPIGTEVKGVAEGVILGSRFGNPRITNVVGKYGQSDANKLVVQGLQNGDAIKFYVNGVEADQTAVFSSMGISTLDLTVTIEEGSGGGGGGGGSSSGGSGVDETPTTTQAAATTSTGATQTTSGVTTTSVSSGPTDTQPAQTTKSVVGPVQTTQSGAEQGQIAGVTTTPASTQAAPSGSDTGDGPNWWLIGGIIGFAFVAGSGWFVVRHVRRY